MPDLVRQKLENGSQRVKLGGLRHSLMVGLLVGEILNVLSK